MEGLLGDVVLTADVKEGLSHVCLPQEADSFFCGVAFAFHFLGPFYKVPGYDSRWISLTRPIQVALGRVIGPSTIIDY